MRQPEQNPLQYKVFFLFHQEVSKNTILIVFFSFHMMKDSYFFALASEGQE